MAKSPKAAAKPKAAAASKPPAAPPEAPTPAPAGPPPDHYEPGARYRIKVAKVVRNASFIFRPYAEYVVAGELAEALKASIKSASKV